MTDNRAYGITLLSIALAAAILPALSVYAAPAINNISVQEPVIPLGDANVILLNCTDNSSNISEAFADISTSVSLFLNNTFTQDTNETFHLSISTAPLSVFRIAGYFNVSAYCVNSIGETANANITFFVANQSIERNGLLNISIGPFALGRFGYFDFPQEITQYSRMNITAEFINTGSVPFTKKTMLEIYGGNFTLVANRTGGTASLAPGARIIENLRYTPLTPGWFWIRAIAYYENKTASSWGTFYVKPYYNIVGYAPPSPPTSGGGGGGGERIWTIQLQNPPAPKGETTKEEVDYGRKEMSIIYPDKISVTPGESSVAYVIVNNSGTMTLREMIILPRINADILIDIQPKLIQTLYGKHSAVFMITLDVPPDVPEGSYSLDFTVSTDKMKKYGHIEVDVGNATVDDSLERAISNYQYLIVKLEEETEGLSIVGIDTGKITPYIDDAKNTLTLAKDAYGRKDYETTRDNLKKTRNSLINAVMEIARARSGGVLVVMAPTIWLLIVLIIIIGIAAFSLYAHRRDAEKSRKEGEMPEY